MIGIQPDYDALCWECKKNPCRCQLNVQPPIPVFINIGSTITVFKNQRRFGNDRRQRDRRTP